MEGEKKRKRTVNGADRRREVAAPSEAEVEEFYAILRRMHVAVKYLQKSAPHVNVPNRLTAMETDPNGVGRNIVRNGGLELDLNTVPEPETNGV
ncbi:uncharacterized protein LOC132603550 [Lycium barbarum]|uniref:uncharacterized protein LOC132603550 n=1 Tax=Lycium barbarum TaxID=112863 RepID=UPI00293E1B81|nr:uncharacterized protein LOC132603550 [Lycium barbarum]